MNRSKSKGQSTLLWWIIWILLTIGSFFVSSHFWTQFIAERYGSVRDPNVAWIWVIAVFGSWMVLLVPLIVVMYAKVDKAYEDARIRRESAAQKNASAPKFPFKTLYVEESKRLLSLELSKKLKRFPKAIKRGHLIRAILKDGRQVENVFIADRKEILGIYEAEQFDFQADDILDIEPIEKLPNFQESKWLRLDVVGS